jgi:hypothetical protein
MTGVDGFTNTKIRSVLRYTIKVALTGSVCHHGRAGLALSTPLYTIRTTCSLCLRLYKVAYVKAVIISFGMVNFK